ncbi:MAG: hypothetical protein WBW88_03050 [Rhodothermales bacterium]
MKPSTWSRLKQRLGELDRSELLALIRDLHAASKDNQAFLNARFGVGVDVLAPYKATISRWISPDVFGNQKISISKAKKAISDYKKAIGRPEGLAELSVFYCECCAKYLDAVTTDYEALFDALVCMFEQALGYVRGLEPERQEPLLRRIETVRHKAPKWGWNVDIDMDDLMVEYGFEDE